MRIAHVTEVSLGGVGAYLGEIAGHQARTYGEGNVVLVVPKGTESTIHGIPTSQIVTFDRTGRDLRSLSRFVRTARAAIRDHRPDIVHLHSTFAGVLLRPWLATLRPRPKVVYCPHGWAFGMEASNAKRMAYAECERVLAKRTDMIVVNSHSERRLAVHYRLEPSRIVAVMNGIAETPAGDLDSERPAHGPIQAAFIGRFDQQKGLDILLDAIERVPPDRIHFHLVGAGDVYGEGGAGRLHRTNITSYGWLPREDVFKLLRRVDVVVMPSRWEAQPLVALEAMRSGAPVVASARGGLPEVVRDGIDGHIFEPDDVDALARLLSSLERQELRRMGQSARRRFEEEFTSERMNERLDAIYRRLMEPAHDQLGSPDTLQEAQVLPASGSREVDRTA